MQLAWKWQICCSNTVKLFVCFKGRLSPLPDWRIDICQLSHVIQKATTSYFTNGDYLWVVGEDAAASWIACSPEWKAIILSWLGAWHDTFMYDYEKLFQQVDQNCWKIIKWILFFYINLSSSAFVYFSAVWFPSAKRRTLLNSVSCFEQNDKSE